MIFKPTPAIKNPETEAACQTFATWYLTSDLPEASRRQQLTDSVNAWIAERNSLARWEVLALSERIRSLILTPDQC